MKILSYLFLMILLCTCGAGNKGSAEEGSQDIGDVLPTTSTISTEELNIASDICNVFARKRQAFLNGDHSGIVFRTEEAACGSPSYSILGDVSVEVIANNSTTFLFRKLNTGVLETSVETDKNGMLTDICSDIAYNKTVVDDQKRTIQINSAEGSFRYRLSFGINGPYYTITRGKYALTNGDFKNIGIEKLSIYVSSSAYAGLVKSREKIDSCSGGLKKFKQSIYNFF